MNDCAANLKMTKTIKYILLTVIASCFLGTIAFFSNLYFYDYSFSNLCYQKLISVAKSPDDKSYALAYRNANCKVIDDAFPSIYILNANEVQKDILKNGFSKINNRKDLESEKICNFSNTKLKLKLLWNKNDQLDIYSDIDTLSSDCVDNYKGINIIKHNITGAD